MADMFSCDYLYVKQVVVLTEGGCCGLRKRNSHNVAVDSLH